MHKSDIIHQHYLSSVSVYIYSITPLSTGLILSHNFKWLQLTLRRSVSRQKLAQKSDAFQHCTFSLWGVGSWHNII